MEQSLRSKKGKVAVVTGAAGALGGAFARRLSTEGAIVIGVDQADGSGLVDEWKKLGAEDALFVKADLSKESDIGMIARDVNGRFGRVDILLNNAGIVPRMGFADMTLAQWREVMAVNVDAMFLLSQAFVSGMVERKYGRIINTTSAMLGAVIDGYAAYITSKGAIVGLTRAMASEFGVHGVTVNCIAPALTQTARTAKEMPDGKLFEIIAGAQAIKRPAVADDYVGAMSFLTSEDSAFMTGQTMIVDGGLLRSL